MRSILKKIRPFRAVYISYKRGSLAQFLHWSKRGHLIRRLILARAMNRANKCGVPLCLQVGGGRHLVKRPGWINGDIIAGDIYLNAAKKLPFESNALAAIFTEQFIEHIDLGSARVFLSEAYRCLVVGGVLRQGTPCFDKLIEIYQGSVSKALVSKIVDRHMTVHRPSFFLGQTDGGLLFVNDQFRMWGHSFIYDKEGFLKIHRCAGFSKVRLVDFGCSETEGLKGLERHADEEWMKYAYVMFLEAHK